MPQRANDSGKVCSCSLGEGMAGRASRVQTRAGGTELWWPRSRGEARSLFVVVFVVFVVYVATVVSVMFGWDRSEASASAKLARVCCRVEVVVVLACACVCVSFAGGQCVAGRQAASTSSWSLAGGHVQPRAVGHLRSDRPSIIHCSRCRPPTRSNKQADRTGGRTDRQTGTTNSFAGAGQED